MEQITTSFGAVLAIDPGRMKCGLAVVRQDGTVLFRGIVEVGGLVTRVVDLIAVHQPLVILCGDGTGAKPILQALQAAALASPVLPVNEAHTSEQARARFVRENRPPLLQRLLPLSLRSPWLPYDDYVAILLAERYWQTMSQQKF